MSGPTIAFRADASVDIGTGHVMRCLTLATAFRERGAHCHFIFRELPGHMAQAIRTRGMECHLLPPPDAVQNDGATAHSGWLRVRGARDADESRAVLDRISPDWLVLDHYALDAAWECAARPSGARLMVLDDLADRPHDCDLLLDQNLGRVAADYDGLLPDRCTRLIGPAHALLRPEFAAYRAESLARRKAGRVEHILISLGGIDRDDVTSRVLDRLAGCTLPADCRITVILGASAPAKEAVARRAAQMPVPTRLCVGVDNMAALMSDADLAIGAGGSTSWERCCLGLPTLLAVLAENQVEAAEALVAAGAAVRFGRMSDPVSGLEHALDEVAKPQRLRALSVAAASLVDGSGTRRAISAMDAKEVRVRRAVGADAEPVYAWRHAGNAARYYRASSIPTMEGHRKWFAAALEDPSRHLLILTWRGRDVGHVRFDLDPASHDRATIGICLDPDIRGEGRSTAFLLAALAHGNALGLRFYDAEIHERNAPSLALFKRAGFSEVGTDGAFRQFVAVGPPLPAPAPKSDREVEMKT